MIAIFVVLFNNACYLLTAKQFRVVIFCVYINFILQIVKYIFGDNVKYAPQNYSIKLQKA